MWTKIYEPLQDVPKSSFTIFVIVCISLKTYPFFVIVKARSVVTDGALLA